MMRASGPFVPQFQRPRCIFLLHTINIEVDDDFDVTVDSSRKTSLDVARVVPVMPGELDQIADAHLLPLKAILDTPLNQLGAVHSIFINFGHRGLYVLPKPRDHLFRDMSPLLFKNILREMFLNERVLNPRRNEELARKVLDMDAFLEALPPICRKIGVLSGRDPVPIAAAVDLSEYLVDSTNDDETLLFVVGDFLGSEIEGNLEAIVKVSEHELNVAACLGLIVQNVAFQWNIS